MLRVVDLQSNRIYIDACIVNALIATLIFCVLNVYIINSCCMRIVTCSGIRNNFNVDAMNREI